MFVKMLINIAWQSLWFRRGSVIITIAAIAVSAFTLLSTEHVRQSARQSFNSTVSGVDLIVGPRTSDVNLLLTTVFRIGQPSQNMSWQSYQQLIDNKNVAWSIPISLGDSHRGFRVVGTEAQFFTRFQYGQSRKIEFEKGETFTGLYEVVLGSQVAKQLSYQIQDELILSHGLAEISFHNHETFPFKVSGILKPTGTPVDNALYVSLSALEAIHQPSATHHDNDDTTHLIPSSISAAMLGLSSKFVTFKVQREINTSTEEPLSAILPGVALAQLWQMSRGVETTLKLMTQLILLASLLGLGAMMYATLRERAYELSVLRTLGANSKTVFVLIQTETLLIATLGIVLGGLGFMLAIVFADGVIAEKYGIDIGLGQISAAHWWSIFYVFLGAFIIGAVPALVGYLRSR